MKEVQAYLSNVAKALARGDATEHTHRAALIELVHALVKGVHCVNEPKGEKHGRPDIKLTLGETPIGYIETKDVGLKLAEIAESAQLLRYRREIPNLVLTDYLQFIWYENGQERLRANVAVFDAKGKLRAVEGQDAALAELLDRFSKAELATIASPKELAQRMASLARMTRRLIAEALALERADGSLHAQFKAFREVLIPDLDETKFADMYAQTICYGLFAAICNAELPLTFARENAADNLPRTNPFLRQLFHHIVGPDLNDKLKWAIDQIVFLLKHADIGTILKDFGKRTRQEDPVVHFYETFLAEYDPKLRKARGVYYTPEPVVSYIVRSVDAILKDKFNKPEGIADPSVLILDPACGTGTFLYQVIKLIHERVSAKGQYGTWSGYVKDNLLPRIFGFELLMAPYAVAHLKLGLLLQETGYDFSGDERLGIYLTNTLEQLDKQVEFEFARWLSEESKRADKIKNTEPIMVVLGNPPYSGASANNGDWIRSLVRDYYFVDGKPLGERNPKYLLDDYVKFTRWSQWRIERTGSGIHAFISNNGYLDNPTFRGMRQQLMRAFDDIHVLDLHGSSKKQETAPDGGKDENVFDIQQGVAIGIFTKNPENRDLERRERASRPSARVFHSDLWGTRDAKYRTLATASLYTSVSHRIQPQPPSYTMADLPATGSSEYSALRSIVDCFVLTTTGVKTHRDHFAVGWDEAELEARFADLRSSALSDADVTRKYLLDDTRDWSLHESRQGTAEITSATQLLSRYLYRPFDLRHILLSPLVVELPRLEVNTHVVSHRNSVLGVGRQGLAVAEDTWDLVTSSSHPMDTNVFRRGGVQAFPLYLYPVSAKGQQRLEDTSPWLAGKDGRRPNLSPKFVAEMEAKLGLSFVPEQPEAENRKVFGPEDVFNYIYAVFHSPTYRKRYAEFLKIDFPRVPLTSDKKQFWKLVALGRELVGLHLLESPAVSKLVTTYPKKGSDTVERVTFDDDKSRVCINDEQYFGGVKPEWFAFHVGGYQVLQKWLKDRKGRKLSADDITHYQRVVVAIKDTIRLMSAVDAAIPKWPME